MSLMVKYKKHLLVFLINFLIFFILFLCGSNFFNFPPLFFIFLCLFSFIFINLIIFYLLEVIKKERRVFSENKQDFSLKINKCLNKMSDHYNIIEISKISFGIYHDLSNILTILCLSLGQLKSEPLLINGKSKKDKNELNLYKNLVNTSTKALSLVSFLKNQHQNQTNLQNFEMAGEIRKGLSLFNYYFKKHKIKVKFSLQGGIYLLADKTKFFQVIMNLSSNAIDSLKLKKNNSSRKIFIKLFKKNGFVYLIFKDNGIGIEADNLNLIFEPFFSLKNKDEGINCGLGLFFCKKIIENDFFGKIKIKSDLGYGAKFTIKIPLKSV